MRGMILAAGRGKRMGALTDEIPKPLLRVNEHYLIEYSLNALVSVGISDIVINVCYRADQIKEALGNGSRYGVTIHYSYEEEVLETGGGIFQALPLLGKNPFMVLSCDVISEYPLKQLMREPKELAHLVLVSNPPYHTAGDFCLRGEKVYYGQEKTLTFGNIGIYRPELFANCKPGKFSLGSLLRQAIMLDKITGEYYDGAWANLGTPDDIVQFQKSLMGSDARFRE